MNASTPATIVLSGTPIDPSSVGGKADALNRLIAGGARVPATGSITTSGYRQFVEHSGLGTFLDDLRRSGAPARADLVAETARVDAAFLDAPTLDVTQGSFTSGHQGSFTSGH